MRALPIHERFFTFQGEGIHMGKPAFFIRTFGCPVKCSFCDSAGTWHPKYVPKHVDRITPEILVEEAAAEKAEIIVVTGGEPGIHDLNELCDIAHSKSIAVHIETSGAFDLQGSFEWITLSPKKEKLPTVDSMMRADEIKLIIESPADIAFWLNWYEINSLPQGRCHCIWLHPEWSQRTNQSVLNAIIHSVKVEKELPLRAGWQLHKLYLADNLDNRTKPLAPLGGDPAKGF